MKLRLAVSHIIYYVNSENSWFNQSCYAVLPHSYHLVLAGMYPDQGLLSVLGTKSDSRVYTLHEKELMGSVNYIFTYVIYSN